MNLRRRDVALVGAVAAAAATMAAVLLLPWHRSGDVVRNGAALAQSAAALGLIDTAPRRVLRVAVALLPLLAAGILTAAVARRGRLAGLLSIALGATALSCALLLYRIDGARQLGPRLTPVVAMVTLGCGLVLVGRRGERR